MKKKKQGYTCFDWTSLSNSPFKWFNLFIRNIQFAYQRIRYGFCESDVWEINRWFMNVVPAMLDDLRESALDYPGCLLSIGNGINKLTYIPDQNEEDAAVEKWNAILKQMAFYIREADEAHCSQKNPYENQAHMTAEEFRKKYGESGEKMKISEEVEKEYGEMKEKYLDEENKIWLYRDACKNRGLQMFQEWFWDLWY